MWRSISACRGKSIRTCRWEKYCGDNDNLFFCLEEGRLLLFFFFWLICSHHQRIIQPFLMLIFSLWLLTPFPQPFVAKFHLTVRTITIGINYKKNLFLLLIDLPLFANAKFLFLLLLSLLISDLQVKILHMNTGFLLGRPCSLSFGGVSCRYMVISFTYFVMKVEKIVVVVSVTYEIGLATLLCCLWRYH